MQRSSLILKSENSMKKVVSLLILMAMATVVSAQDLKLPTSSDVKKAEQAVKSEAGKATSQANIGSLIGQLAGNISDGALTETFKKNKSDFISKTGKVTDVSGAS